MTLRLHYHPLSSFCWKALIALQEAGAPFEPVLVDLSNAEARRAFEALWPIGRFPVLEDRARDAVVGESTAIIEYLDAFYGAALIPGAPDGAWRARMLDRVLDNYVHLPMQKITGDGRRTPETRDPLGVAEAVALTQRAYAYLETQTAEAEWMMGERFGLVDCSALPALFYSDLSVPITLAYPRLRAYLRRLIDRPSVARVLAGAEPYFASFPTEPKPDIAAAGRRQSLSAPFPSPLTPAISPPQLAMPYARQACRPASRFLPTWRRRRARLHLKDRADVERADAQGHRRVAHRANLAHL